jgi:hypothetical protein
MNLLWLPAQVFVVALVSPPEAVAVVEESAEAAPAIEVVRIKRDFGKPHVDMAIDAWTDDEGARLGATRLWWVDTSDADSRKPLGRLIERMVHLQYRRISGGAITVVVAGDGKEFTFTVERGNDGKVHAFVPVDADDGSHVARCRIHSARLLARRVLNVPIGIARIAVTCRDGAKVVQGQVRHREV